MKIRRDRPPAEKAFTESDKHSLGKLGKLWPWTPQRIIKAQELGMMFPDLGADGWARFQKTNLYPGATRDVIIFVYLSTLEPNQIDEATYEEAQKFGIKQKLHNTRGELFWKAFKMFLDVQGEIRNSTAAPADDGDEESPND